MNMPAFPPRLPHQQRPELSCVIPALNESSNLQVLLPLLVAVLSSLRMSWEIIVVDDGSTDSTMQVMAAWTGMAGLRYIQLSRNFGKEAALSAGLEASLGDAVICMDADLQHSPSLIPQIVEKWRNGADMVVALRESRSDESIVKRIGASLLYFILSRDHKIRIERNAGDFRLMSRQVVTAILQMPERTRFMKGLYAWVGFHVEYIAYFPPARVHGQSHFNLLRLTHFAVDGITAYSTWPLRMISALGALVAVAAFAYGLHLVVEYFLEGNPVSGWTTIITTMLFVSGINLLSLGVLGAYVSRIFDEVKNRPLYLIRQDSGISIRTVSSDQASHESRA